MGEEPPKSEPTLEEAPSTTATTDAAAISHTDAAAISDTGAGAISHTNKHVHFKPRAETDPHCPTGGDHNVDLEMTGDENVGAKTGGNRADAAAGYNRAKEQCLHLEEEEDELSDDFFESLLPNIDLGREAGLWDRPLVTRATFKTTNAPAIYILAKMVQEFANELNKSTLFESLEHPFC